MVVAVQMRMMVVVVRAAARKQTFLCSTRNEKRIALVLRSKARGAQKY